MRLFKSLNKIIIKSLNSLIYTKLIFAHSSRLLNDKTRNGIVEINQCVLYIQLCA